jgi:hypothetical protein
LGWSNIEKCCFRAQTLSLNHWKQILNLLVMGIFSVIQAVYIAYCNAVLDNGEVTNTSKTKWGNWLCVFWGFILRDPSCCPLICHCGRPQTKGINKYSLFLGEDLWCLWCRVPFTCLVNHSCLNSCAYLKKPTTIVIAESKKKVGMRKKT